MKVFLFVLGFIFCASSVFALSEAEFQKLVKTWPAFAQADTELGQAWKKNTTGVSREDKEFILKDQRQWIKSGRDAEAQELVNSGYSRRCAYLVAILKRTAVLEAFGHNARLSQEDKDLGRGVKSDDFFFDEDSIPAECAR